MVTRSVKSRITSKAQTTVPKEVRERLGVQPGDELEWTREKTGFRIRKARKTSRLDRWVGYLKELEGKDVDELIEEMRGR